MTNNILPGFNPAKVSGPSTSKTPQQDTDKPAMGATNAPTKDEVKVTEQATRLQQLEGNLKTGSSVNQSLIDEVKAAIANDTLEMNMSETAQKLVEMESGKKISSSGGE